MYINKTKVNSVVSSTNSCPSIHFTGAKPVKISVQNRYNENQSGFVKQTVVCSSRVLDPERR